MRPWISVGALVTIGVAIAASCDDGGPDPARQAQEASGSARVANLHPMKARYFPGDTVLLRVELENEGPSAVDAGMTLEIFHLDDPVYQDDRVLELERGETRDILLDWTAPDVDFQGYLAVVRSGASSRGTGIDVSSQATRFPRYGYVSEFAPDQPVADKLAQVRRLAREFHIDLFQMYDWFWRHELLIQYESDGDVLDVWTDLFGRRNSFPLIRALNEEVAQLNGLAMAYVMIYAAREDYEQMSEVRPEWGMFANPDGTGQLNVDLGGGTFLWLFNPADTAWQDYIISQYIEGVRLGGFDGVHVDQLGPRFDVFTAGGTPLDVAGTFPLFLQELDRRLEAEVPEDSTCVFNIVDGSVQGFATREVATSGACDLLYSELWWTTNTYEDIRAYVEYLDELGGGRPIVLAGYAQYNEDTGPYQQAEEAILDGVEIATTEPGHLGPGYVVGLDEPGDSITWRFEIGDEETNLVTFIVRYANGSGQPARRTVYLDDARIGTLEFRPREQWSSWASDAFVQADVEPGLHTLRLEYEDGDSVGEVIVDAMQFGEFDEDSIRLENAAIFASGATHIQLGDDVQSLTHEYFPNRTKSLTGSAIRALRRQYDFITAYENLLFGVDVRPMNPPGTALLSTSGPGRLIDSGSDGIWPVVRTTDRGDVVHLINLTGVDDDLWRNAAPTPTFLRDVNLRYYPIPPASISAAWWSTPDEELARPRDLEITRGSDDRGEWVEVTIPSLGYWDMIVFERAAGG